MLGCTIASICLKNAIATTGKHDLNQVNKLFKT